MAAGEAMADREILGTLWGYLWNPEHGFRGRLAGAMGLLLISKALNITVNFILPNISASTGHVVGHDQCLASSCRLPESVPAMCEAEDEQHWVQSSVCSRVPTAESCWDLHQQQMLWAYALAGAIHVQVRSGWADDGSEWRHGAGTLHRADARRADCRLWRRSSWISFVQRAAQCHLCQGAADTLHSWAASL